MKALRLLPLALALPTPALAHTGVGEVSGFVAGFGHPFAGIDHLLAMLAVGVWSALALPGKRAWVAPLTFVGFMVLGALLGAGGLGLPAVEAAIALSLVALGGMVALRLPLPTLVGAGLAGAFALFHGHAHGTEASGSIVAYLAGFALATGALHVGGLALGRALIGSRLAQGLVGATIALVGATLLAT